MLYITNNSIKHQSFVHTQLNDQTVLFLNIQYSISQLFALNLNIKQFIRLIDRTLPGATASSQSDLGMMAVNGHSTFPKAPTLLVPHIRLFNIICRTLVWMSYPFAEMQSVYSTPPANWAKEGVLEVECQQTLSDFGTAPQEACFLLHIKLTLCHFCFGDEIDTHTWDLCRVVLFTNPSARDGYDTRSIFKRSLTGFEFRVFLLLD